MTKFSQGGARGKFGRHIATKKDLKVTIANELEEVHLYSTSAFGNEWSGYASALPEGHEFNVVGPDPYTARDWYAKVYRGRDGKVRVK